MNHDRNEALLKIREKIKVKAKDRRKESPTPPPMMMHELLSLKIP